MSECPECGNSLSWRNAGVHCLDCGRRYCKECPDYRWGRFQVRCPDCGCRDARPLENSGGDQDPPSRPRRTNREKKANRSRRRDRRSSDASPFSF